MKKETSLEFKVGLFVLIASLGLGGLLFQMGEIYVQPGYKIRVLFGYTGGLEVGAPVQLAGVPVGEVERITFYTTEASRTAVEVIARVREEVVIGKTAKVRINALSLLGKKHLEILPGDANADPVASGEWLMGQDPVMMEEVTDTGRRVARKLERTVDSVNEWIGDDEFQEDFKRSISNSAQLIADLKQAAASMNILFDRLKNKEGTLGKLIADDQLYEDLKALVSDLKENPWKLVHKNSKKKGLFF